MTDFGRVICQPHQVSHRVTKAWRDWKRRPFVQSACGEVINVVARIRNEGDFPDCERCG